jgi:alkaline phosphatase D
MAFLRTPPLSRRRFLQSVMSTASVAAVPAALTGCFKDDSDSDSRDLTVFVFAHGVASGDPLANAVIIWTRVTPDDSASDTAEAQVGWVVATDAGMTDVVSSGTVYTDATRDYTVKIDVTGLDSDTTYYYQFAGKDGQASTIGKTRTLPLGSVSSVKMAVCSCANFGFGLFNVYQEIANSDADVVLHLGDYIYEYGVGTYPAQAADGRQPEPAAELLTLNQYRQRYAQYHVDTDLQAAHAAKPFICVWDDHELANDTWENGAENHNDGEGEFADRRAAAIQAYHEWLPIRTGPDNTHIYRSFDFGDLVRLHMLDTRILARDKQLSYNDFLTVTDAGTSIDVAAFSAAMADSSRTLLGLEQSTWLGDNLATSPATWDVLGQQVIMGRIWIPQELLLMLAQLQIALDAGDSVTAAAIQSALYSTLTELATIKQRVLLGDPTVTDEELARINSTAPYNLDAWDGYFVARESLLATAAANNSNLIVLAGDSHNAWANNLYPANASGTVVRDASVGVEFATSSVTSPGFEYYAGFGSDASAQAAFEQVITLLVDDLKYLNAANRGFLLVEFTTARTTCDWVFVDNISSSTYVATTKKRLSVLPGSGNRVLVDEYPG